MANLSNINNKFLVTTTGEVLIGQTANDGNRLQITGADGASYIYLKTDVATTGGRIGFNGDDLRVFNQQAAGELHLGTAGAVKMTIDTSGNVGIGTTAPTLKLDVASSDLSPPATTGTVNNGLMRIGYSDRTWGGSELNIGIINAGSYPVWLQSQNPAALGTYRDILLNPNGGNVGIGTTIPGGKLAIGSGLAKTDTSTSSVLYLGQSNEASNYFVLQGYTKGAAAAADRSIIFQTVETGVANAGNIVFQYSGGNVGIGTDSPGHKLDVNGALNVQGTNPIRINEVWFGSWASGGGVGGTFTVGTSNDTDLSLRAGSTTPSIYIDGTNGNVGIGTTGPTSKLHIVSDEVVLGTVISDYRDLGVQLATSQETGNSGTGISFDHGALGAAITSARATTTTWGTDLRFYTHPNATTNQRNVTERMRINSEGNVGIGTETPGAQLHNYSTAANNVFITGYGTSAQNDWAAQNAMFVKTDNGLLISKQNANNNTNRLFNFYNNSSGYASYYMYKGDSTAVVKLDTDGDSYLNGGDVGIGITTPGAQLDVVGPSSGSAILKLQRNGVGAYQYFVTDIGSGAQQLFCDAQQADSGFVFRTRDSGNATIAALYIAPSGNVGIGTTSPGYKLQVQGTGYYSGQLTVDGFAGNSGISFRTGISITNVGIRAKAVGTTNRDGLELLGYNGIDFTVNSGLNVAMRIVGVTGSGMGNVGIGTTSPVAKLEVVQVSGTSAFNQSNNGAKIGRVQYGWYTGQNFNNNTAYVHIKTNLYMGAGTNTMYIMGGFTAKSYSYAGSYGEGSCMFHNWSGSFPGLNVTNRGSWATFMQSPYTSTDGYCVIVLRHNQYSTPTIDFCQYYTGYPWRQTSVTASSVSANTTGVY